MLNIPEKLFILSIDDRKGVIGESIRATLRYGLAGGMLAELALNNKIKLDDSRVAIKDPAPTGNAWFDDILANISTEKKPHKLIRWINMVGDNHPIRRVAEQLVQQNVISVERKKYLWIIPYELYPQVNASAKYWVKQHLRSIMLTGEVAASSDIILLSILKGSRQLGLVFTRDEIKLVKQKLEAMVKGEIFGESVATLLAEIEAAMIASMTAVMAANS